MFYLSDDKYESHIKAVLSECPDADTDEVKAAFIKYEEEFYIPPQDALRSIIRRFQADQAPKPLSLIHISEPTIHRRISFSVLFL